MTLADQFRAALPGITQETVALAGLAVVALLVAGTATYALGRATGRIRARDVLAVPEVWGAAIRRVAHGLLYLPRVLLRKLKRVLIAFFTALFGMDSPAAVPTAGISFLVAVLAAAAVTAVMWVLQTNAGAGGGSGPIIRFILGAMTNGWAYALAILVFARSLLFGQRKLYARKAAQETGYSQTTVERWAEEIRSTDGCARVIAYHSDTVDALAEMVREGLAGDRHDGPWAASDEDGTPALPAPFEGADVEGAADEEADHRDGRADPSKDRDLSWGERKQLLQMDLASALQTTDILWRFAVPAALIFVVQLLAAGLWTTLPAYGAMLLLSGAVGGIYYSVTKWRSRRRLETLRDDDSPPATGSAAILVKSVERPEGTMHMAFVAGRRYASEDPDRLARVVAERALQRINGQRPDPALEERYAWCLRRYIPNLGGWRENIEKPRIQRKLLETVADSPDGIISKDRLAYEVIETDRRYIWRGLRFVGLGLDPDLVAETYQGLVPVGLVEEDITVDIPGGDSRDVTVVHLRSERVPLEVAELRTKFARRFASNQFRDPAYELPDVTYAGLDGPLHNPPTDAPSLPEGAGTGTTAD